MATKRRKKRKASATKRISAALTRYLKKMNPGKMKGVTHVRVKKLKGGGVTITPVRTNAGRAYRSEEEAVAAARRQARRYSSVRFVVRKDYTSKRGGVRQTWYAVYPYRPTSGTGEIVREVS